MSKLANREIMISNVNKKTKEELLEEFAQGEHSHDTLRGEQYMAAVIAKSADSLQESAREVKKSVDEFRKSVEDIGKSSDKLSRKVFWLNVVLAVATVIGAIATVKTL